MIRIVIFNHQRNRDAHDLACGFRRVADVLAIDSGSTLAPGEAEWFDLRLPNVYYSGLLNAAVESSRDLSDRDALFIVSSDVRVPDCGAAVERAALAFADRLIGVYGPSAAGTSFPTMRNGGTHGLRDLPFVDGFCVAARLALLRSMTPVDTSINALGWGLDVHLAWRARIGGYRVVVDDGIEVQHEFGAGYQHGVALAQMKAWLAAQPYAARRGHKLLLRTVSQTKLGMFRLRIEPWWLYRAR